MVEYFKRACDCETDSSSAIRMHVKMPRSSPKMVSFTLSAEKTKSGVKSPASF